MKEFYFSRFEDRKPYTAVPDNKRRIKIFQLFSIFTIFFGLIYFVWRWTSSLNYDAMWFAVPLALAETFSFIGILLFIFVLWQNKDAKQEAPPHYLSDIEDHAIYYDRPLSIDIFIATLNEEAELVRYTIRDAKSMELPFPDMTATIYVLDDGRRDGRDPEKENFKQLCEEENVKYITRETNAGFKAGNLKNGLEHSSGDLFVILDADTRPFPGFLKNTLGYFRKKNVAWVQTCHWFYDTTEPVPLSRYINHIFKIRIPIVRNVITFFTGNIRTGEDIYGSDPRQFYEVIQRRRNFHNASFCCGAASVHRREAVMSIALKLFAERYSRSSESVSYKNVGEYNTRRQLTKRYEVRPFMYHASEDLYTSMVIHSDGEKKWESVMHPHVESRMLSPQDIKSMVRQRTRYAAGSIDIAFRDNPLLRKGLTWRQKVCYFHTVWSYFSCLWILVFLISPAISFFTGIIPVSCSTSSFFMFFIPFYTCNLIADYLGSYGVSQKRGKQYYISLFWVNILSLISVVSGKKVKFGVTPKSKQYSQGLRYSWPHILLILLTMTGIIGHTYLIFRGAESMSFGYFINTLWGLQNSYVLSVFVRAAFWNTEIFSEATEPVTEPVFSFQMLNIFK